jgi:hypothetical protein
MTVAHRELNNRLTYLERCAELAPDGTYEQAKAAAAAVNDALQGVLDALRAHGFKVLNDDRLRSLEAAIYGFRATANAIGRGAIRANSGCLSPTIDLRGSP